MALDCDTRYVSILIPIESDQDTLKASRCTVRPGGTIRNQAAKQVRVTCAEITPDRDSAYHYACSRRNLPATEGTFCEPRQFPKAHLWLDGLAGTGKSTIAQTVADHYHAAKQLGASFFCFGTTPTVATSVSYSPPLASQLSAFNPCLGEHVCRAMRKDIDLQSGFCHQCRSRR